MAYILEFFFYLFFFLYKLYVFLDKKILLSSQGSKIERYLVKENLKNITGSLVLQNKKPFFKSFYSKFKSPIWYKKLIITVFVSMATSALKIAITYSFIKNNFFYISFFSKNIDLVSNFQHYFYYFKILYYILSLLFISYVSYKIVYYFFSIRDKIKPQDTNEGINYGTDIHSGQEAYLGIKGLFQNLLITGSIGSGKTSAAITTSLDYFIRQNLSGLILDVKGNFLNKVIEVADRHNRLDDVVEISLKSTNSYNPLAVKKLTEMEMAYRLKLVLTILSDNNLSDSFWFDKVESYTRDFLVLINSYMNYPTFSEIHKLTVDTDYLKTRIEEVKNKLLKNNYSDEYVFKTKNAINNLSKEYLNLDQKNLNIIRAEITRLTSIFVSDYIVDTKFCSNNSSLDFNSNKIYVLSLNIGENRKLAKVISTYIKLDFQSQILSRGVNLKPVFFLCDEYQEFANAEDAYFFSLSREYNCINILSMQSYSSLINSIKNENAAKVIIQNLVNKIWLRNDDIYTVGEILKTIGKKEKERLNLSIAEGSQNTRYSPLLKNFRNSKSNLTSTYSFNKTSEYLLSEEYIIQELKTFEAICLFSDGQTIKVHKKVKLNN